jgi:hypothetical protein
MMTNGKHTIKIIKQSVKLNFRRLSGEMLQLLKIGSQHQKGNKFPNKKNAEYSCTSFSTETHFMYH